MADQTVLLTGITGFIAKRIALDLLNSGYTVRGSLRRMGKAEEVRTAVASRLIDHSALNRLSFVELDLTEDDGWTAAMVGVDAVLHTASPFPSAIPKDPDTLIRPAVDGALRALKAAEAAGVSRIVLTSSCAAVMNTDLPQGHVLTEADWTDPGHPTATPYDRSKTLAERAAWDFTAAHPQMRLTTINPGLVLGAPLDGHFGTSLGLIERFLKGRDPAVPDIGLPLVDIADVSAMHIAALERPETAGKRYIAADAFVAMVDLTREMAALCPDRRIATRQAPHLLIRLVALWDGTARAALPTQGRRLAVSNAAARGDLGIAFTPWREALADSIEFLLAQEAARG